MSTQKVTILVPNYKTLELTKLCLRLLRKHTDPQLARVIVIDNDSQDDSIQYLRTLSWITLIERKQIPSETPALSHSRALDCALPQIDTPYVLSIHTDTLVRNADWLPFLLQHIEYDNTIAGVGSWKLESKPFWKKVLKWVERQAQHIYYALLGKKNHALEGIDHNHLYLRSHCALYRTDLIRDYQTGFSDGEEVAGKAMFRKFVAKGHQLIFLPSDTLLHFMDHINHATTVLNPLLSRNEKSVNKGLRRIEKSLKGFHATDILQDKSLDN